MRDENLNFISSHSVQLSIFISEYNMSFLKKLSSVTNSKCKNQRKNNLIGGDKLPTVDKILIAVMCGTRDKNIPFSDLQKLLAVLGFQCRIKGDHYIYYKNGIAEIINIQPEGNKAKAYQVKQVRCIILKYKMEV